MSATMTPLVCAGCQKTPEKVVLKKDGTQKLPFKWVLRKEDQAPICPQCKPKLLTRNWSYDVMWIDPQSLDLIDTQMMLGHKYRNELCALEQQRRELVEKVLLEQWPELQDLESRLSSIDESLEVIRNAISKERSRLRKVFRGSKEQQAETKLLKQARKPLWERRKSLRELAFSDTRTRDSLSAVEEWYQEQETILVQNYNELGLYWCNRSLVDQAAKSFRSGAPPRFLRFRGDGHLGVQCQGGLPVAEMSPTDTRFRLEVDSQRPKCGPMATVWIRVGSENREPIWAKVRFRLHRPLPEGTSIKWVHLTRQRIATHDKYKLILAVEGGQGKQDRSESGRVGIDVGWRRLPTGDLRLAYWMADTPLTPQDIAFDPLLPKSILLQGDGTEGELLLSGEMVDKWRKSEELRSTRRKLFNYTVAKLQAWLVPNQEIIPDWLKERTQYIHIWKSEAQLASLVIFWRSNRFSGDEAIFGDWNRWQEVRKDRGNLEYHNLVKMYANEGILHAWQIQDKHLYEYQEGLRNRAMRHRDQLLRIFAALMRRHYKTAIVEDINWRDEILKYKPAEEDDSLGIEKLLYRMAAPGRLIQYLKESMSSLEKNPELTTKRCYECGKVCEFDSLKEMQHECEHCGVKFDIDANAACWLLTGDAASGEVEE